MARMTGMKLESLGEGSVPNALRPAPTAAMGSPAGAQTGSRR